MEDSRTIILSQVNHNYSHSIALSVVDAFFVIGGGLLLPVDVAEGVPFPPPPAPDAVLAAADDALVVLLAFVDAVAAVLFLLEDMLLLCSATTPTHSATDDDDCDSIYLFHNQKI